MDGSARADVRPHFLQFDPNEEPGNVPFQDANMLLLLFSLKVSSTPPMRYRPSVVFCPVPSVPYRLAAVCLLLLVGPSVAAPARSQPAGDTTAAESVGRLVYFEGTVSVQTDGTWQSARIDQPLRPAERLGVGPGAEAEIRWSSGERSTLGPADTQRVGRLYTRAQADAPEEAASLLDRFRALFAEQTETGDDPGGIRRGAGPPFEQATALYRQNQFRDARPLFEQVLAADSTDAAAVPSRKRALAYFALAHCYLETGRREAARSTLQSLVARHPSRRPTKMARSLLAAL